MIHDPRPIAPMNPEGLDEIAESLLRPYIPPEQPQSSAVTLDNLVIEPLIPRQENNNKVAQYFNDSLSSLKQRGYSSYSRHLRPDEEFGILIDAIENPNSRYKSISEDMLSGYGEWLSLAFLRQGDILHCYLDPENLVWNGSIYVIQNPPLRHSGERTFNTAGVESEKWIDLNKFPDELVKFLYSRSFDQLPDVMKSGDKRAQLWIPKDGEIRPCGRGYDFYDFGVVGGGYYGASRGVRAQK